MSSTTTPSLIANSVCPTEFNGPPSATPTVEGFPDVCSIATLPKTAEEPVMTSSSSLHPRGATEGGTEHDQPEEDHPQESGALRTAAGLLAAATVFAAAQYVHTGIFKPGWLEGRNEQEGKWTHEEWKEGEEAERRALGLPPITMGDEKEEEANSR